jgi:TonB family protein
MPQESSANATSGSEAAKNESVASAPIDSLEPAGVFTREIMMESHGYIRRRATHSVLSLVAHLATITVLLVLPLLSSTAPRISPWTQELVTIPLPPSQNLLLRRRAMPSMTKRILSSMQLLPPVLSADRFTRDSLYPAPPLGAFRSVSLGEALGGGNVLGGILSDTVAQIVDPVEPPSARVVRLGGEVTNSRPLYRLVLNYPELAKVARVFGRVVIQAVIDETGKVVNVRAISGPPVLSVAVMDAVAKERFEPMLLNGEPTKCDLTVQVSFHLDGVQVEY